MDWLVSGRHPDAAARAAALVGDHLRRHAADPGAVEQALGDAERLVSSALDPRHRRAAAAPRLDGRPAHPGGRSAWPTTTPPPVRRTGRSSRSATARPSRPGWGTASDRSTWPSSAGCRRSSGPARRRRRWSTSTPAATGRPPWPSRWWPHGRRTRPSPAPQSSGLAGAILAQAALDQETDLDAHQAAALIQEVHAALGSDAQVEVTGDGVLEMSVTTCPFGAGVGNAPSLCHVTAGLAGQIAARVQGHATVVLDETLALGDPGCHLHVRLEPAEEDVRGETHQWPTVATTPNEPTPHLDLSLSLPNESGSVPVVRRLAAQALHAFGVLGEDIDDVQLAITEACANVVDHATDADTYEVKVELAADRCAITVVGPGAWLRRHRRDRPPPRTPSPVAAWC